MMTNRTCVICSVTLERNQMKVCSSAKCKTEYNRKRQAEYRKRKAIEHRNRTALHSDAEMIQIDRPPVRYYGGKWRLSSWIIEQFPANHTTYVEPFCGGASVLFNKQPSQFEIINDLNTNIVTFFDVLRTRPDELIRAIEFTPFSRAELKRAYQDVPGDCEDKELEIARRFYIRSRQSFGSGEGKYSSGWRYQYDNTRGTEVVKEWNTVDHLYATARRLKAVMIECDDAFSVMDRFDTANTLFYVDPPYMFETRYDDTAEYAVELSNEQHVQLLEKLKSLQGMVLLSAYPSQLYSDMLDGWKCLQKSSNTNGNNHKVECLWISPRTFENQLPLFKVVNS